MKTLKKVSVFLAAFAIMCVGFAAISPAYAEPSVIDNYPYIYGFDDPDSRQDEETGGIVMELVPYGKYGKINFEIIDLIPGRLYRLSFNGNISPSVPAGVGCVVSERSIGGVYEDSVEDIMTTEGYIPWVSNGANFIDFAATEESMYFVWGFPLMEKGTTTHYMTLSDVSITDLGGIMNEHPQTDAPDIYVDYANAMLDSFNEPSNTPFGDYTGTVMKLPTVYGRYEKINLPIVGLEPGNSYKLSFTTEINRSLSDENIFGFCISDVEEYDDGEEVSQAFPQRDGYVEWTENGDYEIEFAATADTMYLVWDCSKFYDDKIYKMTFSNTAIEWTGVAPLPEISDDIPDDDEIPEEIVDPFEEYVCGDGYIDLEYATFHGFSGSSNSVHDDYCGTDMNLKAKTGEFEKINIPLEGLTVGNDYKLFFVASLNKSLSSSHHMGYVLSDTPVTDTTSASTQSFIKRNGYVEWDDSGIMQEIDFTATSEKMYLVWECSKLQDGQSYLMSIDTSFLADLDAHWD